jgi:hypothetical protein
MKKTDQKAIILSLLLHAIKMELERILQFHHSNQYYTNCDMKGHST